MKILHILSQRPDSTGSGYYIQNIIGQAEKAGHENYLLAGLPHGETTAFNRVEGTSMDFVRFGGGDLDYAIPGMSDVMPYTSSRFNDLTEAQINSYEHVFSRKIGEAAQAFQPDIIHSHHLWLATAVARSVLPGTPMVCSCHSTDLRQFIQCRHLRDRVLFPCRLIDRILSLSGDQTRQIADLYDISRERIDLVGAGFNAGLFTRGDKPVPPPVMMLYAGKLSFAKGVDLLLECCAGLSDLPLHLHLAGSGTGDEEARCLDLAQRLGTGVTVHGRLQQEQLARLMSRCHLFILPSFFEGLPLVLLEALVSGCRLIATDLPGCRELLAGADAGLAELLRLPALERVDRPFQRDREQIRADLAEVIEKMVQRILQEPSANQAEIDRLISAFTWDAVFARIETSYQKAMAAKIS